MMLGIILCAYHQFLFLYIICGEVSIQIILPKF